MAYLHKEKSRNGYKLRFTSNGRDRVLWLGNLTEKQANSFKYNFESLHEPIDRGLRPDIDSVEWAEGLRGRLRAKLAEMGYCSPEKQVAEVSRLCKGFFDAYIVSRTDWDPKTAINYQQASDCFIRFVGPKKLLTDVTPSDIDRWRLWMLHGGSLSTVDGEPVGYSEATSNKHAKRVKTLFAQAVRDRLLSENPCQDQKIGGEVNRERDHYISPETSQAIINHCLANCDYEWALIFGLCRYAGLRCPTEVLALKWSDIDLGAGKLRIDSIKTGLRYCPIFGDLLPLIKSVRNEAPADSIHVVRKYRGSESNLRSQLIRIVKAAGADTWCKPFVNLRASCRTDMQERFPSHVCDSWMGHSSKVAERHYLQTTEAHWQQALLTTIEPVVSPVVSGRQNLTESTEPLKEKIPGNLTPDGIGLSGILGRIPPTGIEPVTRL